MGQNLARHVPATIKAALQAAIGQALDENRTLSINLSGDGAYELPWEWLHLEPETPFDPAEGPLALVPNIRISRESGTAASFKGQDLRVLVVAADPGSPRFQKLPWLAAEARSVAAVFDASRRRGIELRTIPDAMPTTLQSALSDFRPHLLHFAGHGENRTGGGVLALNGPRANSERLLKGSELGSWLADAETQLVFLSACDTAGSPGSVADTLIDCGVPSVVAMQTPVSDAGQPNFVRVFYGALLSGSSTDEAMAEARQSSRSHSAWASPVLYSSGRPLWLFESKTALGRSPNNLPRFDLPFIGRDRELEEVLLRCRESRLVTLVGPGGMGKTRLAIEAAALAMDDFPDGVWRVECEACSTSDEVLFAIASTLDIEGDERPVRERIVSKLADTRTLLVLDCLERVVAAGGESVIESILEDSPVTLLATSRFRLGIASEVAIALAPLSGAGNSSRELILKSAGREDERLTSSEEKSLRAIVSALEGVPLALIIAAGRLRFVGISELEKLLAESTISTLGGAAAGIGRAISRSLELIPKEDLRLLSDLTVFAGTFTGAEAISVFPDEKFEILEGLGRLADLSLLQPEGGASVRRFRILDSLREFLSKENVSERFVSGQGRHLQLFLERANSVSELLGTGRWMEGTRTLWDALPNLRSALQFAVQSGRDSEAQTLCNSTIQSLLEMGMWGDFEVFVRSGYFVADRTHNKRQITYLMSLEGAMYSFQGDYANAEDVWTRRIGICLEMGNHLGASDAILDLAAQAVETGDLPAARRWLDQAAPEVELADHAGLRVVLAMVNSLYFFNMHDLDRAVRYAEMAESYLGEGASDQALFVHISSARIWRQTGNHARIRKTVGKILRDAYAGDRRAKTAGALSELGQVFEEEGRPQLAHRALSATVAIYRVLGSHRLGKAEKALQEFVKRNPESLPDESPWPAQVELILEYLAALAHEDSDAES